MFNPQKVEAHTYDLIVADSFKLHNKDAKSNSYHVDRGLDDLILPNGQVVGGYRRTLPKYLGRDVVEIIQTKVNEQDVTRILDVGCGEGRFLTDVASRWGTSVLCSGLTAYDYNSDSRTYENVRIGVADAQKLPHPFLPNSFDLVVSAHTMEHIQDSGAALRGIYDVLKVGGISLITTFPLSVFSHKTYEELSKTFGFTFFPSVYHYFHIAFKKEKVTLPLTRVGTVEDMDVRSRIAYHLE